MFNIAVFFSMCAMTVMVFELIFTVRTRSSILHTPCFQRPYKQTHVTCARATVSSYG